MSRVVLRGAEVPRGVGVAGAGRLQRCRVRVVGRFRAGHVRAPPRAGGLQPEVADHKARDRGAGGATRVFESAYCGAVVDAVASVLEDPSGLPPALAARIARHFWWDSSPLMWDSIARTLSVDRHLDAWSQARLLALLNITLADGYIAVLAEKYHPTPLEPAPQPASLRRMSGRPGGRRW